MSKKILDEYVDFLEEKVRKMILEDKKYRQLQNACTYFEPEVIDIVGGLKVLDEYHNLLLTAEDYYIKCLCRGTVKEVVKLLKEINTL